MTTSKLFPCPCCKQLTLSEEERGSYEICSICDWEDDWVQFKDPDYEGRANLESLNQARAKFQSNKKTIKESNNDPDISM